MCSITLKYSTIQLASMSIMACYRPSNSNEDTKPNPEGVYKTLGYSNNICPLLQNERLDVVAASAPFRSLRTTTENSIQERSSFRGSEHFLCRFKVA